jgi:threonine dehydrogenase-like Zn-dependent dehydrogenase
VNDKRIIAARTGTGHIVAIEEDIPATRPGSLLIEVHNSLVSPGTELGGWHALQKRRANPEPYATPKPFGYSNAGVVLESGEGVTEFTPGDRVACIGNGYAQHTTHAVVPHNLCVPLPATVSFTRGTYGMLAATALHAVRRGTSTLGEYVLVIGLGIVGQLTAQLYQQSGTYVMGWDKIPFRTEIAKRWGIDASTVIGMQDEIAATQAFTDNYGFDAAVIAFGGDANQAYQTVKQCLKRTPDGHRYGRIVVVGGAHFTYTPGGPFTNVDIRQAARTGPGYHDEHWEHGPDYPPVFMRWTTKTNLALCMRLIAEGKLNVDVLTTHTIPLVDVDAGISAILHDPDKILGVIFEMNHT